ncbi:MAG: helix-turn-helix domain-containing protein [Agathobacter sp.]
MHKPSLNLVQIGNNLRKMRENRNLTQLQVVDALGVSYCHYARIEEGVRGMSLKMLFQLMAFFDTDANTILGTAAEGAA